MTTTTRADLDLLRARMATAIGGRMAGHMERLGWSPGQLAGLQRARLRALLARAIDRSPFHAARLAGIDPARFELTDVAQLPIVPASRRGQDPPARPGSGMHAGTRRQDRESPSWRHGRLPAG